MARACSLGSGPPTTPRVLVAYHRIDAAEVPDEEANAPTDKIANRNPCDALREEDNDLLSESVDYETLKAFNPHLPPEPEEVVKPELSEEYWLWQSLSNKNKAEQRKQYEAELARWKDYEQAVRARLASAEFRAAPKKLMETVGDLERRGLLQWDGLDRKYNLHPVVRGVASGVMKTEEKERYGQRVVDHFSSLQHNPYVVTALTSLSHRSLIDLNLLRKALLVNTLALDMATIIHDPPRLFTSRLKPILRSVPHWSLGGCYSRLAAPRPDGPRLATRNLSPWRGGMLLRAVAVLAGQLTRNAPQRRRATSDRR